MRLGVAGRRDHQPRARHPAPAAPGGAVGDLRLPHRARAGRRGPTAGELPRPARAQRAHVPRVDRPVRSCTISSPRGPSRSCSCTTTSRPGRYFEPYDPMFADLLELGRREVERLRPRVVCAIADSHYNARELEAMGYRDVRVVPPVVNVRRLAKVEPRESTMRHLASLDGPILLSVGQLMPHKRPDFLVQMMHIADTYLGMRGLPDARRAPTARALHAGDPRAGARAQPQRRARGRRGRRARARRDVPIGRRGRDRERARGLLHPAPRGDDVRQADRRPGLRGDPGDGRRRRGPDATRAGSRRCSPKRSPRCWPTAPLRAGWSRRDGGGSTELERRPPDAAVVEALLEVV